MAFDAGFLAGIVCELKKYEGARVERVQQPDRDAVILSLHFNRENPRLLINAGSNTPRIQLTSSSAENPKVAPMFCMLLRKHLTGAKLVSAEQLDFERAVRLTFETRDELGFTGTEYLLVEVMGRFADIILTDADDKIIGADKIIDFSDSQLRQIMPGLKYTVPPAQPMTANAVDVPVNSDGQRYKLNPLKAERELFIALRESSELPDDKFIQAYYYGISAAIAREIAFISASGGSGAVSLWNSFLSVTERIRSGNFEPVLITDADGKPVEYSFMPLTHYGASYRSVRYESFGALMDEYFTERDLAERIKQRASDIRRLLTNAETRLTKKIALQEADLAACADKEIYKLRGDLITSNIYRIKRGDGKVTLENYYKDPPEPITIELDTRLTPAQNAQKLYKRYAKAKSAELALARQLELAHAELAYIESVTDALSRARTEVELTELRRELYESGYSSKMRNYVAAKPSAPKPDRFKTSGGYEVLCGKNNTQNDYVTFKLASKSDLWFHVKNMPGSHVIILCDGDEPSAEDLTEAAVIAVTYSKAAPGIPTAVDYTRVKNVKKPPASKPGYVTYSTNSTAYVTPDHMLCTKLRINSKG